MYLFLQKMLSFSRTSMTYKASCKLVLSLARTRRAWQSAIVAFVATTPVVNTNSEKIDFLNVKAHLTKALGI